jgi:hypothetical protein
LFLSSRRNLLFNPITFGTKFIQANFYHKFCFKLIELLHFCAYINSHDVAKSCFVFVTIHLTKGSTFHFLAACVRKAKKCFPSPLVSHFQGNFLHQASTNRLMQSVLHALERARECGARGGAVSANQSPAKPNVWLARDACVAAAEAGGVCGTGHCAVAH